jgi:hypothetical protein
MAHILFCGTTYTLTHKYVSRDSTAADSAGKNKKLPNQLPTKDADLNMSGTDDLRLYGSLENKEYAC